MASSNPFDFQLADTAKFEVGQTVVTPSALGYERLTGRIIERRLNPLLQKWVYRLEVPDYLPSIVRFEENLEAQ